MATPKQPFSFDAGTFGTSAPPAGQPPTDPWMAIIPQLLAQMQQQQQPQTSPFAGLGTLLHPAPRHLGMGGGDITNNPEVGGGGGLTPQALWEGAFPGRAGHIASEERAWGKGNSVTANGINPAARAATRGQMQEAGVPVINPGTMFGQVPQHVMSGPSPNWYPHPGGGVEVRNNLNPAQPWSDSNWGWMSGKMLPRR